MNRDPKKGAMNRVSPYRVPPDGRWNGADEPGDRFPAHAAYEPGLLALREGPLLAAAVRALLRMPEVVTANATGRDHPRGPGLALHLGAALDLPSVGLTDQSLLAAGAEPGPERGATSPSSSRARRLRGGFGPAAVRPLVVHSGWRTDLDTAVSVALAATWRARTAEPLRRARREARRARAAEESGPP